MPSLLAAPVDLSKLPPPSNVTVDFSRDIQPIFEQSCYKCHGVDKPKSGFDLSRRTSALKGGETGVDIIPGDSAKSPLIHYVAGISEEFAMPPEGKAPPLTTEQVSLLRAWIDQGAKFPTEESSQPQFSVEPTIRWTAVHGDKKAFREQFWRKEGFAGGVEHFAIRDESAEDVTVAVDGHVFSDANEVMVKFAATRKNFGFVHVGYEQYQRYYDDTGGYAPTLPTNSFSLNRNLHLDIGRAWIDLGLTLPDKPRVVIGYEYQFRDGNKSTLQWGPVGTLPPFATPTDAKNIYPASKNIDERTHILKFDASHEINGWYFEDNARVEFYKLITSRQNVVGHTFGPTPNTITVLRDEHDQISGANTFHVNKQLTDWMFASGGYLYSKLGADASFQQNTVNGVGGPAAGDQWFANQILLDRESHAGSVAALFGPWEGLSLSSGVQGEWMRQRTMGDANFAFGNPTTPPLFLIPVSNEGNLDDAKVRENVALRFTKIPFTTLYAETRLQQETLSRFEEQIGGFTPFTRDTDADIQSMEYRVGFDTSPIARTSFGAHYKHGDKQTDYVHLTHLNPSGRAYPGFLLARDIITDEVEPRLVIRPATWLRTTLSYKLAATDFKNATAGIVGLTPGGPVFAGNYDEHIYSANVVLTPIRRFYLSSTVSLSDSR
ncbi:MAG: Planctomycete cytochrome, partial [Verrucomicrobiales bacterium]|nr:Planctomycete cytochrome [Verrucomicrobiales bacterium]